MTKLTKILLLFIAFLTFTVTASAQDAAGEDADRIFDENTIPEACRPKFPGGEAAFMKAVAQKMVIPPSAIEDGVRGRVTLSFVVRKDGSVKDIKVLKGLTPDVDKACIAAISKIKEEWEAGRINGIPVNVRHNVTISVKAR